MTLRAVSLFAGAGGMTLGVERAGFSTIVACECDPWAAATHAAAFPDVPVMEDRVEAIPWEWLRGRVDLVYGGPPCQPFSASGKGLGQLDPRDGVPHFLAAVGAIQPRAVIFENVQGLTFAKHRAYLAWLLESLARLGYATTSRVLDAADYSVPQRRHRLFVIALRAGTATFRWPAPTHCDPRRLALHGERPWATVREALGISGTIDRRAAPSAGARLLDADAEPAPTIADAHGRALAMGVPQSQRLMDVDRPARTIEGGTPNGETGTRAPRVAGADNVAASGVTYRRLTWRECAALQSFPDDYPFAGGSTACYRMVGNALPPPLAEAVARAVADALRR